jgi:hypothetical protein
VKQIEFDMYDWRHLDEYTTLTDECLEDLVKQLPGLPVLMNYDWTRVVGKVVSVNDGLVKVSITDKKVQGIDFESGHLGLGYAGIVDFDFWEEDTFRYIGKYSARAVAITPTLKFTYKKF